MDGNYRYASHRLRRGRCSEAGRCYLVTAATQDRRPVFSDWCLGRIVVRCFRAEAGATETVCFVVMPDHFHWLFQLRDGASLPSLMQRVKSVSAHRVVDAVPGTVWQRGYHDRALRFDEDLRRVARYVVANPLRAGLVQRLGDYPLWDAAWL